LASSTVVVPLTVILAAILPFNKTLPIADLAFSWCFGIWMIAPRKGNVVRGIIGQVIWMAFVLWQSTFMAPLITAQAIAAGYSIPAGVLITNMTPSGWFWPFALAAVASGIFGANVFEYPPATMLLIGGASIAAYLACWWICRDDPKIIASISKEEMYKRIAKKQSIAA